MDNITTIMSHKIENLGRGKYSEYYSMNVSISLFLDMERRLNDGCLIKPLSDDMDVLMQTRLYNEYYKRDS